MAFLGYFDDFGNTLNPDLVPKQQLCIGCKWNDDPTEEILCNLNRLDQQGSENFKCGAYVAIGKK